MKRSISGFSHHRRDRFPSANHGGRFVFAYLPYFDRFFTGLLVGVMSVVSLITSLFLIKPRTNTLVYPTVFMLAPVILQGALGFSISHVPWQVMVHYANALVIFAISIATMFSAIGVSRMDARKPVARVSFINPQPNS